MVPLMRCILVPTGPDEPHTPSDFQGLENNSNPLDATKHQLQEAAENRDKQGTTLWLWTHALIVLSKNGVPPKLLMVSLVMVVELDGE